MPYVMKTSIPLRATVFRTPGDFGPLPILGVGAAQLNRPRLGALLSAHEDFADRPWRNLAHISIGGSSGNIGQALGYYAPITPRVGVVRPRSSGLSGYYRIDLAQRI